MTDVQTLLAEPPSATADPQTRPPISQAEYRQIITREKKLLGSKLKEFRDEKRRISQEALGKRTGYSRSSVGMMEAGRSTGGLTFWAAADAVLRAGGELLRHRQRIEDLMEEQKAEQKREDARRRAETSGDLAMTVIALTPDGIMLHCPHCLEDVEVRLIRPAQRAIPAPSPERFPQDLLCTAGGEPVCSPAAGEGRPAASTAVQCWRLLPGRRGGTSLMGRRPASERPE